VAGGTTVGVGTVAGAAGGFAIASGIADRIDEFLGLVEPAGLVESTVKAGKDIRTGATYEMGGQVAAPLIAVGGRGFWGAAKKTGLGRLFKKIKTLFPSLSNEGMVLKAKEMLGKIRAGASAETTAKTAALKKRLDIKTDFSFAQKTGLTKAAAHEQSMAAKDAELMQFLKSQDEQILKEASSGVEAKFVGKGTIRDVTSAVEKETAALTARTKKAQEAVAKDVAELGAGKDIQIAGMSLDKALATAQRSESARMKELYDKIPRGVELTPRIIKKTIKQLKADFKKIGGGSKSYPKDMIRLANRYLKKNKGEFLTFDQLRDLRGLVGESMRDAYAGAKPNMKLGRRLKVLKDGIDKSLDEMLKLGGRDAKAATLYREASREYVGYVKTFKEGQVGKVLETGARGRAVPYSEVPQRFFASGKMDAADDLIRVFGRKEAASKIDDFAGLQLVAKAEQDGVLNMAKASAWLKSNYSVLKKYGLAGKYTDIIKKQRVSDDALAKLDDYGKTVASRIIGMDVDAIIPNIFSGVGRKASQRMAQELLNLPGIKNNPAAKTGLQKAFKDFYLGKIDAKRIKDAGTLLKDLRPGLKVLYKDKPKQLQALYDYHELLGVLSRNKNVTYAGGSTTTEKLTASGTLGGIFRNLGQLWAVKIGKGWFVSSFVNLGKAMFSAPGKYSQQQVERLLVEAIVDPKAAQTIMMATKRGASQKVIHERMRSHLVTLGLYQADR
jgi:hypothetical protein